MSEAVPAPPGLLQHMDKAVAYDAPMSPEHVAATFDWIERVVVENTDTSVTFSLDELHLIFKALGSAIKP